MSTRACYVFSDEHQSNLATFTGHVVFKHHDGYPSGAIEFLEVAKKLAWELPRFEATEFAAAFVAANKDCCGGVRLLGDGLWSDLISSDSEYVYFVAPNAADEVTVRAIEAGSNKVIFEAPLKTIGTTTLPEDDED